MKQFSTKATWSALVFFLVAMVLGAQGNPAAVDPATVSRVFAVNLWSAPVDIQLGLDGIFVVSSLGSNQASQMVEFNSINPRGIKYKASSSDSWMESKQADGKALPYLIQAGKTYLILVQSNGVPGLYELTASSTSGPKLAVFNASEQTLPVFQLGVGFNQGAVVLANDLQPGWTNFADVPGGKFGAFWTYQSLPPGISYFYAAGRDGKSLGLTGFVDGGWYVTVIWNDGARNQSGGTIWDITPRR